jgi:hypothetical protein
LAGKPFSLSETGFEDALYSCPMFWQVYGQVPPFPLGFALPLLVRGDEVSQACCGVIWGPL